MSNHQLPGSLTGPIMNEDWVLIEGSPETLTSFTDQIRRLATAGHRAITLDRPGPFITVASEFGLIVARESGAW